MARSYDVVVVGGGIHGVGVAQAAAASGHRVLLLEKRGLASGTSGRSSRLIHGGLRYLESWELSLVYECLHERSLLLKLAPDLVEIKRFYIPIYRHTRRRPWLIRAGLSLYAVLGGLGRQVRFAAEPRTRWGDLDGLVTDGLDAVFRYYDAQTDDAMLTNAVMHSAIDLGAELTMPARFCGAVLTADGCVVRYIKDDRQFECQARVVVNAGGPWANLILANIEPQQHGMTIELVQGAHILVEGRVEKGIYYVESPRDGRAVFVMPHGANTLVGTTEVRYRGDPDDVRPLRTEMRYLASVLKRYFPHFLPDGWQGILDARAGLRVLPAGQGHAFHRSRETVLQTDRPAAEGVPRVLTIYGGKLTTYRSTAGKVLDRLDPALPTRARVADTRRLRLTPP